MAVETYRCSHCGVIFKDPQSHEDFILQKTRYDLHENDPEDEGYRRYFQQFLDFVLPQMDTPATALDFGCGRSTLLADMLTEQGMQSRVYDPIYHPDNSYREHQYDLITSVEVFEHLHDPMAVFATLVSLLNPNGILAIRTAFTCSEREAYLRWYYRRDPTHIVFFAPRTFEVMCAKMGLRYVGDNGKYIAMISSAVSSRV
jgi:2-polyprenyl-3-methyl-5-hydroxy-6-metoxy-1,4-benzoquinol methylase